MTSQVPDPVNSPGLCPGRARSSVMCFGHRTFASALQHVLEKKQLKGGNRFITLGQYNDLEILADVGNPSIPSNFELIYVSNSTGAVIYKINHSD